MVVSADLTSREPGGIAQQVVGERLASLARASVTARRSWRGPRLARLSLDGDSIRVSFTNAVGLATADGGAALGFEVASRDGRFQPATAVVEGESVIVFAPLVAQPTAVRYGWADEPEMNLRNGAGLPVAPFRSPR